MSPHLRRLLIDYIRIGGWFWFLIGFTQVSATLSYAEAQQLFAHISYPMVGALIAPLILSTAQQRGWFQILMTLPLPRRDIGRVRWWAAVGLPGLFLTAVSVLAIFAFSSAGWPRRPWWQIGLWLLNGWAILGLWTHAQSWLRATVAAGWRAALFVAAVALVISSLFIASGEGLWRVLAIGTTAAGLLVDIYLYARAEDLLLWQVGRVCAAEPVPATAASPPHLFGWGVLARQLVVRLAIFAGIVALFLGFFSLLFVGEGVEFHFVPMSFLGFVVVLSCFLAAPWLSAARAFRPLPITADRLAAIFLVMTMAPAWAFLLTAFATFNLTPTTTVIPRAPFAFWSIAMAALCVPFLLRFGQRRGMAWIAIPILVPAPLVDPWMAIFYPDLLDTWMRMWVSLTVALAAIIGTVSYLWTRHELRAGQAAYKPVPSLDANVPT